MSSEALRRRAMLRFGRSPGSGQASGYTRSTRTGVRRTSGSTPVNPNKCSDQQRHGHDELPEDCALTGRPIGAKITGMTNTTTHGPGRVDPSDLHPHTYVAVCAECVPGFYARSWAYLARSDAEWHNTATGHDVSIIGAEGQTESLTDESPIRNIAVGPNDGTWIPGAGYANGRTVAYMVAVAIIAMMGGTA